MKKYVILGVLILEYTYHDYHKLHNIVVFYMAELSFQTSISKQINIDYFSVPKNIN